MSLLEAGRAVATGGLDVSMYYMSGCKARARTSRVTWCHTKRGGGAVQGPNWNRLIGEVNMDCLEW